MIVKFRVNLGTIDAAQHQLDYRECQKDREVKVEDAAGEWLCSRGIAELVRAVPPAAAIKAVPPDGSVEKATQDLEEYRDKQKRKPRSVNTEE